ncbi:MAG TPA: hypothetical protein VLB44_20785 [Kofleriaceae bacterium]|nr:hypothetical protein [Kofleriaceae bacterium]
MKWLFVISVALTGACGDREAHKLAKIRDEVCACKTARCAEAALDSVPKKDIRSTPKSQRIAREMLDCLAQLYEAERPTTDPDAVTDPGTEDPASARMP